MDLSAALAPFLEQQGVDIIHEMTSATSSWEQYVPSWAKTCILSELSGATPLNIRPQHAEGTSSKAKDEANFRAKVLQKAKAIADLDSDQLDAVCCVALLFDTVHDMARNDLTVAKAFFMLAGEQYRSHNGTLFQFMNGSLRKTQAVGYSTAENMLHVTMVAEALLVIMAMFDPPGLWTARSLKPCVSSQHSTGTS